MIAERATAAVQARARTGNPGKLRRYANLRYGARSWRRQRRVTARLKVSAEGSDTRFVVTNLDGKARALYERLYCARGQMENLIKAHKTHLAADRTSCHSATANQCRRTEALELVPRPVRHPAHPAHQSRRPRRRDDHPHQGPAAHRLPGQGYHPPPRRHLRRPRPLITGPACPARTPPTATPGRTTSPHSNRAKRATLPRTTTRPRAAKSATPVNRSG